MGRSLVWLLSVCVYTVARCRTVSTRKKMIHSIDRVKELKRKGSWQCRWTEDGRIVTKTFPTAADAERFRADLQAQMQSDHAPSEIDADAVDDAWFTRSAGDIAKHALNAARDGNIAQAELVNKAADALRKASSVYLAHQDPKELRERLERAEKYQRELSQAAKHGHRVKSADAKPVRAKRGKPLSG